MIFLDTSAVYALADASDPNHTAASRRFRKALETRETILVHNYVLIESAALLQRRLGLETALRFLAEAQAFRVCWVTAGDHGKAVELLREKGLRGLSLVDCVSFVVMRRLGVSRALAFDDVFAHEGFSVYED